MSRRRLPGTLLLAGAAVLAAWALAILPRDIRGFPATPFDRTDPALAPVFRCLTAARASVPREASVTVIAEPRDAARETSLYGAAVALLDGRRVLPAAQWGAFTPGHELEADYVVVCGARPASPPGPLVAELPAGFLFRRNRP